LSSFFSGDGTTGFAETFEDRLSLSQVHLSFSSTPFITCASVHGQRTVMAAVRTMSCQDCIAKISLFLACSTCLPQPFHVTLWQTSQLTLKHMVINIIDLIETSCEVVKGEILAGLPSLLSDEPFSTIPEAACRSLSPHLAADYIMLTHLSIYCSTIRQSTIMKKAFNITRASSLALCHPLTRAR